jgi:hypothetical protein
MQRRVAAVVAGLALSAAAGCDGGGAQGAARPGAGTAPVGTGYTSDQLRQALPVELVGYQRTGEPDAGEYDSLQAIQNFTQLQRQVTLDKPQCANTSQISGLGSAPAALIMFTKANGQSTTATLIAVPSATAEQQLRVRVPAGCRSFRAKIGQQWSTHEVIEVHGQGIGLGARTVGVTTTTGSTAVKTWYVVLRGRGYLGTITLYGPNVTRTEAERLARQTYDHAERILP